MHLSFATLETLHRASAKNNELKVVMQTFFSSTQEQIQNLYLLLCTLKININKFKGCQLLTRKFFPKQGFTYI